jgi:NAD(P)-dependent dehydrogenase (short-subunit alcohol dehydrogenase family)
MNRKRRLEGKVSIITGAADGIGQATSVLFAREGAKVIVADVDAKGGQETAQLIKTDGGQSIFIKTDVSRAIEVETLIQKSVAAFGSLDCAFNNAGVSPRDPIATADSSEEDWEWIMNINLKGTFCSFKLKSLVFHMF